MLLLSLIVVSVVAYVALYKMAIKGENGGQLHIPFRSGAGDLLREVSSTLTVGETECNRLVIMGMSDAEMDVTEGNVMKITDVLIWRIPLLNIGKGKVKTKHWENDRMVTCEFDVNYRWGQLAFGAINVR